VGPLLPAPIDWKDPAAGTPVTIRRDGDKLRMKPGNAPEGLMTPRSETRFITPWGSPIEFKLDANGKATSGTVEQGRSRARSCGGRAGRQQLRLTGSPIVRERHSRN